MNLTFGRAIILVALALSLSGCPRHSPSNDASTHSVDWYLQHERERNATLATCHRTNNENQDCQNAFDAAAHAPSAARNRL
ncbi:MAG: EexN family lipoprotein [Candidatus Eremiobacteraeota bacterium]|nr:EexN family lipoprotein [Candidatus Eremiobacteraeota bacterium]MBC5804981.1 EexN family lipoprotein [Candidatus Eremiobacteraeota bacterium]MBC5820661.1 EexN family lipoprotein [Candidatus Eremiobacteraeota bacterium]